MFMPLIKALVAAVFIACITGMFFGSLVAVFAFQAHLSLPFFIGAETIAGLITAVLAFLFFRRAFAFERFGDARKPLRA
jgi:predicted membrane chloride channel (bestrophin family)